MFGPFTPGDSLWVYRLQRRGVSLDPQRDFMQPRKPLWEAWVSFLSQQAMGRPTFSLSDAHDGQAFIQVRYRPHQAAADVVFLAPSLEHEQAHRAWRHLLDGACVDAGGQGIQRVFASLPLSGEEVDVFQQAGFAVYAREDIFRRKQQSDGFSELARPPTLRPQKVDDWPAIQKLCVSITPQRVRQAEGGIALAPRAEKNCQRYVVPDMTDGNIVATLTVCAGGQAHWLGVLVHPSAQSGTEDYAKGTPAAIRELVEQAEQERQVRSEKAGVDQPPDTQANLAYLLLVYGLARLSAEPNKPVYCSLRQYESGVQYALQAAGFELHQERVLAVKHTVAWIKTPSQDAVPILKRSAEPVGPTYRINGEPDVPSQEGRLATGTQTD